MSDTANQDREIDEILAKYRSDLQLSSHDYAQEEITADRMEVEFEAAEEETKQAIQQLIDKAVREARIDQADKAYQLSMKYYNDTEHFGDRDHALNCLSAGLLGQMHHYELQAKGDTNE